MQILGSVSAAAVLEGEVSGHADTQHAEQDIELDVDADGERQVAVAEHTAERLPQPQVREGGETLAERAAVQRCGNGTAMDGTSTDRTGVGQG